MAISKNKSYIIKRLLDGDKTLKPEDLELLKVVELLKMIEEQKLNSIEIIQTENYVSLANMCGCSDI